MSKVMDSIIELTKNQVPEVIGLSALGGRICYSSDSVDKLLSTDKRLLNADKLLEYLIKLLSMGHLSVFEHSVLTISKEELVEYLMLKKKLSLRDLLEDISPNIVYLLDAIDCDTLQHFPVIHPEQEKDGYYDCAVHSLKTQFHILPYTNNTIFINFRHIFEYMYKKLGDWSKVSKWFNDTYGKLIKQKYTDEYLQTVQIKSLNDKQATFTLMKLYYSGEKVSGITFILEGVSRVLTHQLVRHRLFCSYSQRSHRHTKIKNVDEFVYPPLDYIKLKKVKNTILTQYQETYKSTLETYQQLVDGVKYKNETFKVKKEDARFIIPSGIKTTIMVTMLTDGLFNFIKERKEKSAQWEIREIGQVLSEIVLRK